MDSDTTHVDRIDGHLLLTNSLGALAVVAGAFLMAGIASSILLLALGIPSTEALQGRPALGTIVNAAGFVGFIVAALGYLAVRDEWDVLHVRRPTLRDVAVVVAGLVALAVAATAAQEVVSVVMGLLESLFGVESEFGTNQVVESGRQSPQSFLYMIPVAILLVGPGEELVFRGVVQGLFRRALGVVPAVFLASLLFGLMHTFAISSGSAWTYVFVAGAMGLVLGGLYEYTENIAVPAAVHGLWNAAIFAYQWALATGGTVPV